ncbi:hypothetical protein AGMMS50256_37400 [Betaproteobacteria bacterium]|nr:hypothetical protein AGMMS50256_37400 [Betaproteobacteria bacterium]
MCEGDCVDTTELNGAMQKDVIEKPWMTSIIRVKLGAVKNYTRRRDGNEAPSLFGETQFAPTFS